MGERAGVTLVEVAVVIGAIAVLVALALPGALRARGAGRKALSGSNLRQMAIAAQQYATLFDSWPVALRYENAGGFRVVAWDWEERSGSIVPGPLWTFSDKPDRVMQCPEYRGASPAFEGDPFTGYNYNTSFIGGEQPWGSFGWEHIRWGIRPHACRRTDSCAIFGAGGRASAGAATNKFMRSPLPYAARHPHESEQVGGMERYHGAQAFRYVGNTTLAAYLDGHVESHGAPHRGPLANDARLAAMGFPENGFLSEEREAYDPR